MVAGMKIIGIDPGLANTGFGVIEFTGQASRLLAAGDIVTRAGEHLPLRLKTIHDRLAAAIEEWKPDAAAIENLYFCTNVRTAISVAQGRGVCILATAAADIPLAEYTPLQIKLAVAGYGKATKQQVQKMVKAILGLRELPASSHSADAIAVALCHAHSQRYNRLLQQSTARS
jgi:crossover junction endodeoxyribonuclease RuvC